MGIVQWPPLGAFSVSGIDPNFLREHDSHLETDGRKGINITLGCDRRGDVFRESYDQLWRHPTRRSSKKGGPVLIIRLWECFFHRFGKAEIAYDGATMIINQDIALQKPDELSGHGVGRRTIAKTYALQVAMDDDRFEVVQVCNPGSDLNKLGGRNIRNSLVRTATKNCIRTSLSLLAWGLRLTYSHIVPLSYQSETIPIL